MNQKSQIFKKIAELSAAEREFAVVTVVSATEGTPRGAGARMIVYPDGMTEFTVGGGNLEEIAKKKALRALKEGEDALIKAELKLEGTESKCARPEKLPFRNFFRAASHGTSSGRNAGMVCGGDAELYIEVFKSSAEVIIFGGGHIGLALSKFLDILGMGYRIYDDRKEFTTNERFPNAAEVRRIDYSDPIITTGGSAMSGATGGSAMSGATGGSAMSGATGGSAMSGAIGGSAMSGSEGLNIGKKSYCVIVTHGHKGDKKVLKSLLKTEAPYIGMIGSRNKVKAVMDMLKDEKVDVKAAAERVYTPIGLDIGGDSPEEISISILAEIFKVKNSGTGVSIRDKVGQKTK